MKLLTVHEIAQVSGGEYSAIGHFLSGLGGAIVGAAVVTQYAGTVSLVWFGLVPVSVTFGGALLGVVIGDLIYDLDHYIVSSTPASIPASTPASR